MAKEKGMSAMSMRLKIVETIRKMIDNRKEIDVNEVAAQLSLMTGYNRKFIMEVFDTMEQAREIIINDDGIAKLGMDYQRPEPEVDKDVLAEAEEEADSVLGSLKDE